MGSHRGQKDFFFILCCSLIPLLGLTPSGLFMGSISTKIYTSELNLCFTICVPVLRGTTFICLEARLGSLGSDSL